MTSDQIIKGLELAGEAVGMITNDITIASLAVVAIKGIFSVVLGSSLQAPEYAAAMRTGLARNAAWGQNRVDELDARN
jgi:hypothetical protein